MEFKRVIGIVVIIFAGVVVIFIADTDSPRWGYQVPDRLETELIFESEFFCENILLNITDGKWSRKIDSVPNDSEEYRELQRQEKELDSHLTGFRIKRGIHSWLWREDLKCGFRNYQRHPKGKKYKAPVGSWCDATSDKPCCSDRNDGVCGRKCDCPKCVDMRKIKHAEVSTWLPQDPRCKIRNYTSEAACEIVKRFSGIHFVGDCFVRKLGRGFILTLKSDPNFGGLSKYYDEGKRNFCVGVDQFYWRECNYGEMTTAATLLDPSRLCGGSISVDRFSVRNPDDRIKEANHLVRKYTGKEGTVIFVGVGSHYRCDASYIYNKFLLPSVKFRDKYYEAEDTRKLGTKWPHIVFLYPDKPNLLKSVIYDKRNGEKLCERHSNEMEVHCRKHGIPVLDFRKVTTGVHSYDGAHYGLGVNLVKAQLVLNYLHSLTAGEGNLFRANHPFSDSRSLAERS